MSVMGSDTTKPMVLGKKWKTCADSLSIEPVEFYGESANYISIKFAHGIDRVAKRGGLIAFHDTVLAAYLFLSRGIENRLAIAAAIVATEHERLEKLNRVVATLQG